MFVGLGVGDQVTAAAGALVAQLQNRASKLAPHARITWIPAERLHLTVRFIGNVDDDKYRAIARALAPPIPVRARPIRLSGTGAFPKSGPPRVIWAGLSAGLDILAEVERHVTNRLASEGIQPEERAYGPHLTLARVREAAGLRASTLLEGLRDVELGDARVEAITLFESRLSPKGPAYIALQQTKLV